MNILSWRYTVFSYIASVGVIIFILIADSVFKDMPVFIVQRLENARADYLIYWKEATYVALGISCILWLVSWLYYRYNSAFQFYLMQRRRDAQRGRSEAKNLRYSIHKE